MLTYLIQVTRDLTLCSVMLGMMVAYVQLAYGTIPRRLVLGGGALGFVAGCVAAYLRNTTKLMNSGTFNFWLFGISVATFVLFVVADLGLLDRFRWANLARGVVSAVFSGAYVAYVVQYVLGYVKSFLDTEGTFFSTAFLLDMIGWTAGIVLAIVLATAINRSSRRLERPIVSLLLKLVMALIVVHNLGLAFQSMLQHNLIRNNRYLFFFIKHTTNSAALFAYIALGAGALACAILWMRSLHQSDPYSNPAEHRKVRAKWRNIRRWACAYVVCALLVVLNLTVVNAYNSRPVELSPVEDYSAFENNTVLVSLDLVSDGELHRFAYTSDSGAEIRFIVIQKPNSTSYGVGMDSCDICGETGYYQRGDQVVCKKCDVVMNINTIGFAGGCNPKVFDYTVSDGYIRIPVEGLLQYESDFK